MIARRRGAGRLRGRDVVERAHLLRRGSHDHGEAVPFQEPEHQDHDPQRAADNGHDGERHQNERHREPHRDDEGHRHVDAAAEIAGGEAQTRADQPRDQHHGDADQERDAGAVDHAREVVAAEIVGAEDMRPGAFVVPDRRNQPPRQFLRIGVVRSEQRRQQRHQHRDRQQRRADHQAFMTEDTPAPQRLCRRADEIDGLRCENFAHASADPDARVEPGVGEVGEEREGHVHERKQGDDRLRQRNVLQRDRLEGEVAESVEGEDRLDDD